MILYDSWYIENINWAMVFVLESEHDLVGKEIVCEDGRITQVYEGEDRLVKENPPVGSEVWIDGECVGVLKQAYAGRSLLVLNGNFYSPFELQMEFEGKDIRFVTPDRRLMC